MTTWKPEGGEMPDHVRKVLEKFDNRPVEDKPLPRLKLLEPLPVASARLYRLKVTLLGTEPPVWRRIVVPTFMKLEHLHTVLQTFMGWKNAHVFEFIIDGNRFVAKGDYQFVDNMWRTESGYDADEYELTQLFKLGKTFTYIYNYGDRWEHERRDVLPRRRNGLSAGGLRWSARICELAGDSCRSGASGTPRAATKKDSKKRNK